MKHELSKELTYKVNSKEEYREFLEFIKSKGFNVYTGFIYTETWKHVQSEGDNFRLINNFDAKYPIVDCKDVIGFKDSEEFVLPEKWCVCPETEFEQFKKYVLKSSVKSEVKNQFVKGDYIVIISGRKNLVHVVDNYCYKQFRDSSNLVTDTDNIGGYYSADDVQFDNTIDKWRYATPEEIAEYNRINKPYDVTTLNVKKDSKESPLPDYQIGKWYKWFWKVNSKITYGKINGVIPNDCFNVSEGIHNDKYCKINGYFFKDCESIELLTDLSEIQEYLHDGHVDIVKSESKSLVGRYLKALVDRPDGGCIKKGEIGIITKELKGMPDIVDFPNQRGYYIVESTYNRGKSYELMPEGFNPNSDDSFSESVSIEEIQEQCKEKFPIGCTLINTKGEEVVLTEDDCTYKIVEDCIWANPGNGLLYDGYEDSWAKLIELPKTESKSKLDIWLEETKAMNLSEADLAKRINSGSGFIYDELEGERSKDKAKILYEKWNPKVESDKWIPQVGDRVRVIAESDGWGDVKYGDIGTVVFVHNDSLEVDFPNKSGWEGTFNCFELVKHEFTFEQLLKQAEIKFPVGSEVKLLAGRSGIAKVYVIPEGFYQEALSYPNKSVVSTIGCPGYLYYEGEWAELLEKPLQTSKQDIMTEEKFDSLFEDKGFKVGDWVVITSLNSKLQSSLSGKIGHIFQIGEISGKWHHCTEDTYCEGGCWPADCLRKATPEEISKITGKSVDKFHYGGYIVIKESKSSKFKPVDILNKYQQTPVIYSDKKVKSKLVTIFN